MNAALSLEKRNQLGGRLLRRRSKRRTFYEKRRRERSATGKKTVPIHA
jgi:hypothetical protein